VIHWQVDLIEQQIEVVEFGRAIHCVSKNAPTLKGYNSKLITRIDFHDIWQKYLKYSRIEFACFSFPVALLFYQLFVFQT